MESMEDHERYAPDLADIEAIARATIEALPAWRNPFPGDSAGS